MLFGNDQRDRRSQRRKALVIGNSLYPGNLTNRPGVFRRLSTPVNDAIAMTKCLQAVGFEVMPGGTNLIEAEFVDHVAKFIEFLEGATTVVVYYSGHGLQIGGQSYAVPVDAQVVDGRAQGVIAIDGALIQPIQKALESSPENPRLLVFLDACRAVSSDASSDPGRDTAATKHAEVGAIAKPLAGLVPGLAEVPADRAVETFIAYATAPGLVAYDGGGTLSPFTEELAGYLGTRGLGLTALMQWVGEAVKSAAKQNGRIQVPWSHDNFTREFYFKPADNGALKTMLILGAVAGVLTGLCSFRWCDGQFLSPDEHPSLYFSGLIFGSAIGWGVYLWGQKTIKAFLTAVAITAASAALAKYLMVPVLTPDQRPPNDATLMEMFGDQRFTMLLNTIIAMSLVFAFGVVASAAVTSPAIRRIEPFAIGLVAGGAVALLYIVVIALGNGVSARDLGQPVVACANQKTSVAAASAKPCQGGDQITWVDFLAILTVCGFWHALLAGGIGRAFDTYVPIRPPQKETASYKPALKAP